jgi:hypothetical protein
MADATLWTLVKGELRAVVNPEPAADSFDGEWSAGGHTAYA